MNAVVPFAFEDSLVRAVWRDGDPWFVAKDICGVLGIEKHRDAIAKLDEDERGSVEVDTLGGRQSVAAVSEGGLYTIVLRCRDAVTAGSVPHRFRRWVTGEVLPVLRKTDTYAMPGAVTGTDRDAVTRERELRLETVAEARRLYGPERARHLWEELGLPAVPPLPAAGSPARVKATSRAFLADPIAPVLQSIAEAYQTWTGTPVQLLEELERTALPAQRCHARWPQNVNALGKALSCAIPLLRCRDVLVERRHSGVRTVTIVLVEADG